MEDREYVVEKEDREFAVGREDRESAAEQGDREYAIETGAGNLRFCGHLREYSRRMRERLTCMAIQCLCCRLAWGSRRS